MNQAFWRYFVKSEELMRGSISLLLISSCEQCAQGQTVCVFFAFKLKGVSGGEAP